MLRGIGTKLCGYTCVQNKKRKVLHIHPFLTRDVEKLLGQMSPNYPLLRPSPVAFWDFYRTADEPRRSKNETAHPLRFKQSAFCFQLLGFDFIHCKIVNKHFSTM
mmetsp:Transcript_18565/g.40160  ORF Transcript_18565/g.40160 Transcript_18565/m.40160 type:complete len:105 (-) Transcript_18565:16-330(-)